MTVEEFISKSKKKTREDPHKILFTPQETNYDKLFQSIVMPPWQYLVSYDDVVKIYNTITNKRLSGNFDARKKAIEDVLVTRGFKFMAGGTNRLVFKHMEIPNIVAKVPLDRVGLNDNIHEQRNQKKLWPYCAKMIQVTPHGVIGFAERVEPILNRLQFNIYSLLIYMTTLELIGKYVMEDIGTDYFKNWGIRKGFGPVILDYPYTFDLDGNKLICHNVVNNQICMGEIDYDPGFNHLYCTKCGRRYDASELQMAISSEEIQLTNKHQGGKKPMLVRLRRGDEILASSYSSDTIVRPDTKKNPVPKNKDEVSMKVFFKKGDVILSGTGVDTVNVPEVKKDEECPNTDVVETTISLGEIPSEESAQEEEIPVVKKSKPIEDYDSVTEFLKDHVKPEDIKEALEAIKQVAHDFEDTAYPTKEIVDTTNVDEPVIDQKEEEATNINTEEDEDEFPPVQWKVPQKISKSRIITNNQKGDVVRHRPNDPYKSFNK